MFKSPLNIIIRIKVILLGRTYDKERYTTIP